MGNYERAFASLNDAQRQAVTTTDGPVLVIAGPGTGKTQLLTTRIAHILATTDVLPQNILCLTFTESAATTMRERLSGMVGQAAYDVNISTYHAFGSELIRRFSDYFTDNAELKPVDDLGIDRIFRTIIAGLPYSNPLKFSDAYVADIKTLVSDAKRALLTPKDLRNTAHDNLSFIATASPVVAATLGDIPRLSKKDVPNFAALVPKLAALTASAKPAATDVAALGTMLVAELQTAVDEAAAIGKQTPLTKWKNKWLAKDDAGHFVVDGAKANHKLLAAADVYDAYLSALKSEGLFDYDDMILRAVHALETNNDLRFTLQEQYLYILLDEFQDTNGAQLRLVELLTDNPVNEGRPNVLAVGDDDQAIYAFQGADYSHMLQFKEIYKDVLPVPLTQNYRSHADILHMARGIAEQIEERLHHHFPAIEKTLTADGKNLSADAVVERREAQSDVMQYAWVARRISELIEQGVPASDIAVLAPKHKYLEPLVPFLQAAGVPLRYEKRENVLDDPAINQLLRMSELSLALAAGDHTRANTLWAQVLSFGFWELPTSSIWQLSWQTNDEARSWTDVLLADDHLKPIALFFIRLSNLSSTETLETMLDYMIGSAPLDLGEPGYEPFTSPYYAHYFGNDDQATFWNLLTNLIVLRARLREYHKDGEARLQLADFIAFVEAHRAAELKILNTSPYASGTDAVELMTAFKAKGMEWGAVFVLAVNDEAWGGKAHNASARISLPPNLQFIRYAGATNDERLRLFYVAITRAKSQLYMVNFTSNYAGKGMTHLKYLDESADEHGVLHSPLLPESKQLVLPAEDDTPAPTTELAAYWQQRHTEALTNADMRALIADRLQRYQLSPTHVNDFIDLVHCGPQVFFLRTILRFPQAPRPEGEFGSTIHETLEWLHNTTRNEQAMPSETTILKWFKKRLETKQFTAHDLPLYTERGEAVLRAYVEQRAGTITPDVVAEHSFKNEGVFIGKAHLAGKIDKLIVDKTAKTITIVDYKTGRGHSHWSRDVRLHKYRKQLYLYRALVEGSHTFAGYRVTDAYLEFVEPDENGKIQVLSLTFDEAEYAATKQLAEAIWRRVMAMDLPDATQYTADIEGILQFEKDLLA
jgi:DNA helicase-2/ATP-dependent DNA helicase PcrA